MSEDFGEWIGRSETRVDRLDPVRCNALFAAFGSSASVSMGDTLPLLHHWLHFWDVRPPADLGEDGHPAKGGFLPPIPLPRRMWAGGRLRFEAPLVLGEEAEKVTTIRSIALKDGRSGTLVFVTLEHQISGAAGLAIVEEQDLVYRAPTGATPPLPDPASAPPCGLHRAIHPDSVMLFRYSALTMNGHRIHYDRRYAADVESYPALVVHGPLQATLLGGLAQEALGRPVRQFDFRGQSPAFDGIDLHLCCTVTGDTAEVWSQQGSARAMVASAS